MATKTVSSTSDMIAQYAQLGQPKSNFMRDIAIPKASNAQSSAGKKEGKRGVQVYASKLFGICPTVEHARESTSKMRLDKDDVDDIITSVLRSKGDTLYRCLLHAIPFPVDLNEREFPQLPVNKPSGLINKGTTVGERRVAWNNKELLEIVKIDAPMVSTNRKGLHGAQGFDDRRKKDKCNKNNKGMTNLEVRQTTNKKINNHANKRTQSIKHNNNETRMTIMQKIDQRILIDTSNKNITEDSSTFVLELALIQLGIRAKSRTFFYDESEFDQAIILLNQIFHYQRVDSTTLVNVIGTHINDKRWEHQFCHDDSVRLIPNYEIDENLKKLQVLAGSANDADDEGVIMIAAQLDKAIIMLHLLFVLEKWNQAATEPDLPAQHAQGQVRKL